jgi:signal transduction histidine kinase
MRWFAGSLRRKLALVVLATTAASLVLAGASMAFYELHNYRDTLAADLRTQSEIIGRASAAALAFDDQKAAGENLALLKARPDIVAAAIYNARGKLYASFRAEGSGRDFPALPEAEVVRVEGGEIVLFRRIVDANEILGTVYLRARYELVDRLAGYVGILGAVLAISLVLGLLISHWLLAALTRPVLAVTAAAREVVEKRDFSLRVQKTTDDEVGVLVDAFNGMLAEIGRSAGALEDANRSLEREIVRRNRADDELRALNADLERRVGERTQQLETANKDLEGFSYSVSHDLRAPLRGVIGFAEALVEDHGPELSEEARRKMGVVQDEARRMGMLIDDLLAFSRLGRKALQLVDVDMERLARSTYEKLEPQYANGHDYDAQIANLPPAKGDRALLGQVWVNLISNALKFSANRDKPRITVSAVSDEKEHIYFVRDNGAGFDPRYQAKLFGVFQRLHSAHEFPGTGVGLALVQRIVERHGGRVWAEGKPGEGATFYFALQREPSDARH